MNTETHQTKYIIALEMVNAQIKDCGCAKRRKKLEDIQKVLFAAIENEKKMIVKFHKLRAEKAANASKVKAAILLSEEDENTISLLRNELEKAWCTIKQWRQQGFECNYNTPKSFNELSLPNEPNEAKTNDQNAVLRLKKEISESKEQKKNLLSEIEFLKRKLDERERNSHLLEVEKKRLLSEVENSKSFKRSEKELEKQLKLNVKEIQKLKIELSEMREKAITENEKFKLQIFELEEELADKEKREEELKTLTVQKRTQTVDHEVQTVIDKYTSKVGDVSSKQTFVLKYKRKIKKVASDLDKVMHLYNSRGLTLKKVRHKVSATEEVLNSLKSKYIRLRDDLNDKKMENDMLIGQNGKLKDEVKKLSMSISILEEIRDDYVCRMGKQNSELDHLKEQLEKVKHDNSKENWEKQLSSLREQEFLVEHKLEEMRQRHKAYEDILLQIHCDIDKVFDSSKIKFSHQSQNLKNKYTLARSLKNKVLVLVDNFEKLEAKTRILNIGMSSKESDPLHGECTKQLLPNSCSKRSIKSFEDVTDTEEETDSPKEAANINLDVYFRNFEETHLPENLNDKKAIYNVFSVDCNKHSLVS